VNIPENILSTLTDEQKKKLETVQSPEELLAIAKEAGYELSPDQLEAVAGGDRWLKCDIKCWEVCNVVCLSKGCIEYDDP
jgi:hypothetical protein